MARPRNPNRDKAKQIWLNTGKPLKDIAKELGESETSIRKWKCQDEWESSKSKSNVTKRTKSKSNVTKTNKRKESAQRVLQRALFETVEENEKLTEKQKLFCFYYVQSYNATQSYLKAYECDYETAKSTAYRMLDNIGIQEEIVHLKEIAIEMKHIPSADETLAMYGRIAKADAREFVTFGTTDAIDEQGQPYKRNYLRFREMEEVDGSVITEISLGRDGAKIKTGDKMKALDFFAKYHGLDQPRLGEESDSGFLEALTATADEVWNDEQ